MNSLPRGGGGGGVGGRTRYFASIYALRGLSHDILRAIYTHSLPIHRVLAVCT